MINYLLGPKLDHPLVVVVNLRQDLVLECDGATYGIRETSCLEHPILITGVTGTQLEVSYIMHVSFMFHQFRQIFVCIFRVFLY